MTVRILVQSHSTDRVIDKVKQLIVISEPMRQQTTERIARREVECVFPIINQRSRRVLPYFTILTVSPE